MYLCESFVYLCESNLHSTEEEEATLSYTEKFIS